MSRTAISIFSDSKLRRRYKQTDRQRQTYSYKHRNSNKSKTFKALMEFILDRERKGDIKPYQWNSYAILYLIKSKTNIQTDRDDDKEIVSNERHPKPS